jgi:hypothetical protein
MLADEGQVLSEVGSTHLKRDSDSERFLPYLV